MILNSITETYYKSKSRTDEETLSSILCLLAPKRPGVAAADVETAAPTKWRDGQWRNLIVAIGKSTSVGLIATSGLLHSKCTNLGEFVQYATAFGGVKALLK
uniref:Uncharacterized protein n=1 Tax=Romanomermis culicivorax TaxID=13658 RepID=A0A915I6Y6_ROMCU